MVDVISAPATWAHTETTAWHPELSPLNRFQHVHDHHPARPPPPRRRRLYRTFTGSLSSSNRKVDVLDHFSHYLWAVFGITRSESHAKIDVELHKREGR